MVAVMPGQPAWRHPATWARMRLMLSFSCIRSEVQFPGSVICSAGAATFFLGFGIGMKHVERRRSSTISLVMPSSSNRK